MAFYLRTSFRVLSSWLHYLRMPAQGTSSALNTGSEWFFKAVARRGRKRSFAA
jgi:hypothetical protein